MNALERSLSQCGQIASLAIVVDAKTDDARRFYQKYDFIPFPDFPRKLFLPMKTIKKLFS